MEKILEIMRKWGSRIQTHQYDECAAEISQLMSRESDAGQREEKPTPISYQSNLISK